MTLLNERQAEALDESLAQAERSGIAELKSLAQGIRRDYAAVRAAFSSQWSNGQVEAEAQLYEAPEKADVWQGQV